MTNKPKLPCLTVFADLRHLRRRLPGDNRAIKSPKYLNKLKAVSS